MDTDDNRTTSEKSDAATTTEDMKMAPLCLFYFSHPFGILSPNPPTVTMAPQQCIPSWLPTTFSDTSWKQSSVRIYLEADDTEADVENLPSSSIDNVIVKPQKNRYKSEPKQKKGETNATSSNKKSRTIDAFYNPDDNLYYSKTATPKSRESRRRDRFSSIEDRRYRHSTKLPLPSLNVKDYRNTCLLNPKVEFHKRAYYLPPLEKNFKETNAKVVARVWPDCFNKFKRKSLLPPIDLQRVHLKKLMAADEVSDDAIIEANEDNSEQIVPDIVPDNDVNEDERLKKGKKSSRRRIRPVRSSRGVNKGRSMPNRSAARKLVTCLLQNAARGQTVNADSLPALGDVLKTVRQAWGSPKSLLPQQPIQEDAGFKKLKRATMSMGPPLLPGASPGLLKRRYSLPETVMRKYKLAQQKSESEESEIGSAPSPRISSPARGSRGRDRGPRSMLLRRIWGRDPPPTFGGSHSELRYWDSRSGSSSPRSPDRGCEACKRLSDKNLAATSKSDIHSPPVYRSYAAQALMSPKRQRFKCGSGSSHQSPERYVSHVENARNDPRQSSAANATVTSASERSSLKSVSMSDSSSKLGLSSLVTSSYPTTDNVSTSDISTNMTRSSGGYSSDDTLRSQSQPVTRPKTATDLINSSPTHVARRKSDSTYTDAKKLGHSKSKSNQSLQFDNHADVAVVPCLLPYESKRIELNTSLTNCTILDASSKVTSCYDTPVQDTTTTPEKTTESRTTTVTTTTRKETTSPSDSAMSTEKSMDFSGDTRYDCGSTTDSPASGRSGDKYHNRNQSNHDKCLELSDTGISIETVEYEDSSKNTESSHNEEETTNSKNGSVYSESCSTDLVTCIEKANGSYPVKSSILECLEVIVSETLSSSAFDKNHVSSKEDINCNNTFVNSETNSKTKNKINIDQYVSNILIDSLNNMTEQLNEINSNVDEDMKLNILEKEIKVRLQSINSSPINLITNPIITTLITSIPDKELLETTVIEEKSRSVAYTTESKLFPIESRLEIESSQLQTVYDESPQEEITANKNMEDTRNKGNDIVMTRDDRVAFDDQEVLNNNVEFVPKDFYMNESQKNTPYDVNDNQENGNLPCEDVKTKAVLRQLHKMFENNMKNSFEQVDSNFNLCMDSQPKAYFCGTTNEETSHLEMSTDVDVFVDNSLNKMINSIDINYNESELCESIKHMTLDKLQNGVNDGIDNGKLIVPPINIKEAPDDDKTNMISNIGTGSMYQKPPEKPLVVPRYSAIPHTESMEVNTSSEDDDQSCQSDCMSLVDSLDDPNSPRPNFMNDRRCIKKVSKHDKKPVRGDIMSLLPENAATCAAKLRREKSETFFVPIAENSAEVGNVVVADRMPEKLKEKLHRRQQKRELKKEYYRRKKMKQLKREIERQRKPENKKASIEKECAEVVSSLVDQVVENAKGKEKGKDGKTVTQQNVAGDLEKKDKKPPVSKRSPTKPDKAKTKDNALKNVESFVIDKRGNYQTVNTRKMPENREHNKEQCAKPHSKEQPKMDDSYLYVENVSTNSIEPVENIKVVRSKREYEKSASSNESGPRRLYQKTEFLEGDKHVEILEIVECLESSPEPPSDDSQESPLRKSGSKIPVLQKSSKSKGILKPNKISRTSINKSMPMNLSVAKNDRDSSHKASNSKTDQLIANILIDAFNEDNPENRDVHLVMSPRDKKSESISSKKNDQSSNKKGSPVHQKLVNHTTQKYTRKFEVIPEEKSSISLESSNEDTASQRLTISEENQQLSKDNDKTSCKDSPKKVTNKNTLKTIAEHPSDSMDVASQTNMKVLQRSERFERHDVSTSPIPQYISTATSPIPHSLDNKQLSKKYNNSDLANLKGKKALGTKDGWAGFCRPQTRYSPDNEGSHPSSNNPSDKEAIGKIKTNTQVNNTITQSVAPTSQRVLRTTDSRDNIKQTNIRKENRNVKNTNDVDKSETKKKSDAVCKNTLFHKSNTEKQTKHGKSDVQSESDVSNVSVSKINVKSSPINLSDSHDSAKGKVLKLPSPLRNQSLTQSSDMSTSSESDSEAVNCPVLVPRWPPIAASRHRRNYNRRQQRQEDSMRMPFQNVSSGWSVTLAGSCYTALPSDVEMKVCFPKSVQQTTSQSDSGLGEEHHYRKQGSAVKNPCKKCGNFEIVCKNCKAIQDCNKCSTLPKNKKEENENNENQPFLPFTQSRKSSLNRSENAVSVSQVDVSKRHYNYLPDVSSTNSLRSKKKTTLKMARRFSLHCWLPEDRLPQKTNVAKMEITETISPIDGNELSVFGCAIMPEIKPRVPTMSERDLTRMHTAQFYSRNRRF